MPVSKKSVLNFVMINSIMWVLARVEFMADISLWWPLMYFVFIVRNYICIFLVESCVANKKSIGSRMERAGWEEHGYLWFATVTDLLTHTIARTCFIVPETPTGGILARGTRFVMASFCLEIVFDFFHYWTHRLSHEFPVLYKLLHKTHHRHHYPHAIHTFYHSPLDLIWSNTLPIVCALLLSPFTIDQKSWHLILLYKTFIEVSGHTSKILAPTGSFPQFIWLPRWLGIQLYTEDHTLHHIHGSCNFGKRFSLWDRIFGTYRAFHSQS